MNAAKPITYAIKAITPALVAGVTGNTLVSGATPFNTATYNVPSSVTAETTIVISATTGTAIDASAQLILTIKPKP